MCLEAHIDGSDLLADNKPMIALYFLITLLLSNKLMCELLRNAKDYQEFKWWYLKKVDLVRYGTKYSLS